MNNYAIVKIGGLQYKVAPGDTINVDRLAGEKDESLTFNEVLLLASGKKIEVGQPLVKGAKVKAQFVAQIRGEKVRIAKFQAKSYHRAKGFRSSLTTVKILDIIS